MHTIEGTCFDLMFPHKVWGGEVVICLFCEAGGEAMLEVSFGFFWGGQASVSGFPLPARSECQAILARLSSGELLADSVRVARLC